jgi:hypothetical protein
MINPACRFTRLWRAGRDFRFLIFKNITEHELPLWRGKGGGENQFFRIHEWIIK